MALIASEPSSVSEVGKRMSRVTSSVIVTGNGWLLSVERSAVGGGAGDDDREEEHAVVVPSGGYPRVT